MIDQKPHDHEWERGRHMTEAFGVDGRMYACAICGATRPPQQDEPGTGRMYFLHLCVRECQGACVLDDVRHAGWLARIPDPSETVAAVTPSAEQHGATTDG